MAFGVAAKHVNVAGLRPRMKPDIGLTVAGHRPLTLSPRAATRGPEKKEKGKKTRSEGKEERRKKDGSA